MRTSGWLVLSCTVLLLLCLGLIFCNAVIYSHTSTPPPPHLLGPLLDTGTYVRVWQHASDRTKVVKHFKSMAYIPLLGDGDECLPYASENTIDGAPIVSPHCRNESVCYGQCGKGWGMLEHAGKCRNGKCNGWQALQYWCSREAMRHNNKERERGRLPHVVHTQIIDADNWIEDKVVCNTLPPLFADTSPKWSAQLHKLNKALRDRNLYMLDVHKDNIALDQNGDLQSIDGEILSSGKTRIFLWTYKHIRGFTMVPYAKYDRIYFANEPLNLRGKRREPISKLS